MNDFMSFDLLSVGDASIDAFLSIHDLNEHCRLDKEKNELCFKYGEKILVDDSQFLLGGNGCNVAVGASRLGIKTSFASELGDDEFSEIILKGLKKEKIDLSKIEITANSQANFSIVLTFKGDKVLFARHVPRKHDFSFENVTAKWVYLTSMGKEWKTAYQKVLEYVQKTGAKLAFNPGTTQIEEGIESFIDIIKASDIFFVNRQEAVEISNIKYQISNIKELLLKIKTLGSKIVVMTDNTNGSYAIDESGKVYHVDIFPGEPVQKTGAGDAYTSGFLSAIILGNPIQEAMKWGAINSAGVIQKIGAQTGLLKREEISEKIKESVDFKAE